MQLGLDYGGGEGTPLYKLLCMCSSKGYQFSRHFGLKVLERVWIPETRSENGYEVERPELKRGARNYIFWKILEEYPQEIL